MTPKIIVNTKDMREWEESAVRNLKTKIRTDDVRELIREQRNIPHGQEFSVEFKGMEFTEKNGVKALQLSFDVKTEFSLLMDTSGNYIEEKFEAQGPEGREEPAYEETIESGAYEEDADAYEESTSETPSFTPQAVEEAEAPAASEATEEPETQPSGYANPFHYE